MIYTDSSALKKLPDMISNLMSPAPKAPILYRGYNRAKGINIEMSAPPAPYHPLSCMRKNRPDKIPEKIHPLYILSYLKSVRTAMIRNRINKY